MVLILGRSKLQFINHSSPNDVVISGRDCSLQRHFPMVASLLRSGDVSDHILKLSEIASNSPPPANFTGKAGNFCYLVSAFCDTTVVVNLRKIR